MAPDHSSAVEVSDDLLAAIHSFPTSRRVEHCGEPFQAHPFDQYADCPVCGLTLKLRSFSAQGEIEDVFDAVFEWMNKPGAADEVRRRQEALQEEFEPPPLPTKAALSEVPGSMGRSGRGVEYD